MDPNFTRTTSDKYKTSRNNAVKFETIENTESERSAVGGSEVKQPKSTCACTNISIMQLFHEMKQEYPTVPDQIVSQLVTENCHNRNACLESLKKESLGHPVSAQVYPSLSIHNNKSLFSTMNNSKNQNSKIVRHLNEHLKKTSDMSCNNNNINNYSNNNTSKVNNINNNYNNNNNNSVSDNNMNVKRPTTLSIAKDSQYPYVLRKAPPPPTQSSSSPSNSGASSANSSSMSSPSISSQPLMLNQQQQPQQQLQPQQQQHVLIDSQGIKSTDSLNVQLNVTVSPISSTPDGLPPIPPRPPLRPPRHTTQLNVHPDLPYSSILDNNNNNQISQAANGQRSYTSVNFMLRQPTAILPAGTTPIDIQAGPSSLTYSSSSFDAKQGYQSHLKITVAGNGESCISAVRTKSPMSPLSSQIDTTINIGEPNNSIPLRIPQITKRSNGLPDFDEVQLISLQKKQKEVIECELRREKEKLNMIKFDVTTLSETKVTRSVIQILREDIQKLRAIIKELTDELDELGVDVLGDVNAVVSRNQSSPSGSIPRRRPPRPPPPIPQALRSNQSPLPDYNQLYYANSNNNNINNSNQQSFGNNLQRSNSQEADGPSWTCSMCTFQNHPLLNQCEECNLPRIQTRAGTIQITSSNFQPLRQTINYQQSASPSLLPSSTSNRTLLTNNNDPNNANSGNTIPATVL